MFVDAGDARWGHFEINSWNVFCLLTRPGSREMFPLDTCPPARL